MYPDIEKYLKRQYFRNKLYTAIINFSTFACYITTTMECDTAVPTRNCRAKEKTCLGQFGLLLAAFVNQTFILHRDRAESSNECTTGNWREKCTFCLFLCCQNVATW